MSKGRHSIETQRKNFSRTAQRIVRLIETSQPDVPFEEKAETVRKWLEEKTRSSR